MDWTNGITDKIAITSVIFSFLSEFLFMKNNEGCFNVLNICIDKIAEPCKLQKCFELPINENTTEQGKEMSNDAERIEGKKLLKARSLQPSIHSESEPQGTNIIEVISVHMHTYRVRHK